MNDDWNKMTDEERDQARARWAQMSHEELLAERQRLTDLAERHRAHAREIKEHQLRKFGPRVVK